MLLPVTLAFATAFTFATSGILIKNVASKRGYLFASFAISVGDIIVLSIAILLIGLSGISYYSILLSVLSGIFLVFGYILFYKSLENQQASNTYATVEVQVLLIALYGIFALGESVSIAKGIGIMAIVIGVLFISIEKGMRFNTKLVPAVIANVFWALSWISLVYPINNTSNHLIPTLISFIVYFAIIVVVILTAEKRRNMIRTTSPKIATVGIAAGISSGIGNSIFTILTSIKQLVTAAVVSNTSPAIVAVLAHFIYHDKLSKIQILGLAIVVCGGIILGVY